MRLIVSMGGRHHFRRRVVFSILPCSKLSPKGWLVYDPVYGALPKEVRDTWRGREMEREKEEQSNELRRRKAQTDE